MNNGFNVKHLECFKKCYINPSHSIIAILILHLCVTYQTTVKLFQEIGLEILQPRALCVDFDKMKGKHLAFLSSLHSSSFLLMKKRLNS